MISDRSTSWMADVEALVQLGGLEPPTSCSTDRRSNQLSYNCILAGPETGSRTGRKLGATPLFGKAAGAMISALYASIPLTTKSPGELPGLFALSRN